MILSSSCTSSGSTSFLCHASSHRLGLKASAVIAPFSFILFPVCESFPLKMLEKKGIMINYSLMRKMLDLVLDAATWCCHFAHRLVEMVVLGPIVELAR